MRYAVARRDDNEALIVRALQRVGASVHRLDDKGIPDLLVGRCGKMFLLEVKREKGGRLTKAQKVFRASWKGPMPIIVRDPMEALEAVGALTIRCSTTNTTTNTT